MSSIFDMPDRGILILCSLLGIMIMNVARSSFQFIIKLNMAVCIIAIFLGLVVLNAQLIELEEGT